MRFVIEHTRAAWSATEMMMMASSHIARVVLLISCATVSFKVTPTSATPHSVASSMVEEIDTHAGKIPAHESITPLPVKTSLAAKHDETRPLYKDSSQPVDVRTQDLLARMTLDEKVAQLT